MVRPPSESDSLKFKKFYTHLTSLRGKAIREYYKTSLDRNYIGSFLETSQETVPPISSTVAVTVR